ncbi:tigger transposable element-derived protein 6-like [Planococcus citri]|uniref:tigger transposable element-derived protein 6-like n=1 Tax=Planococcus citri TaxID=170843 RepID=UPI0031F903BC
MSTPSSNRDVPVSKKRTVLCLADKLRILKTFDESVGTKQCDLAKSLGIASSSLRTIIEKRKEIEEAATKSGLKRRKIRAGKYDKLETVLMQWYKQARDKNYHIDGPTIQAQSQIIAKELNIEDFSASNGWLHRFRLRHNISHRKNSKKVENVSEEYVESSQNNDSSEECVEMSSSWIEDTLPSIISGFTPRDVFNADECALFFKLMPDQLTEFQNEICREGEQSEERLTILLCANADGTEKLTPLVVGKLRNLACFKHIKSLPCSYVVQKTAWINANLFKAWLKKLDCDMKAKHRKVLLLIDNCSAHLSDIVLENVLVKFFPATADRLQPLQQGVMKVVKQKYRSRIIERCLQQSNFSVNVLDALHYLAAAWDDVSAATIQHCFQKSGFFSDNTTLLSSGSTDDDPDWLTTRQLFFACNLDNYIRIDDDVSTCAELSFHDIIASRFTPDEEEEEDEEEEDSANDVKSELPPSKIEALDAIDVLRRYFSSVRNDSQYVFNRLNKLETDVLRISLDESQSE